MKTWLIYGGIGLVGLFVGIGIGAARSGSTTTKTVGAGAVTQTVSAGTVTQTPGGTSTPYVLTVTLTAAGSASNPGSGGSGSGAETSIPGNGTFLVGTDIEPGTYRAAPSSGCYWARLKNLSGDLDAIVANDNTDGQVVVRIAPTDKAFTTTNCSTFKRIG